MISTPACRRYASDETTFRARLAGARPIISSITFEERRAAIEVSMAILSEASGLVLGLRSRAFDVESDTWTIGR